MTGYVEDDYSSQLSFGTWKAIFRFAKPFRRHMALMVLLMVGIASIDSANPLFTRWVIDHVIVPRHTGGLPVFGAIYAVVIALQAFIIWLFISIAGKIEMGVCYEIRRTGFQRLQELSFSYYDRTRVGWIMARMTSDTSKLADVMAWGMVDMSWGIAMMLGLTGVMVAVNWRLALVTLAVVPILAIMSVYFQRNILSRYRKVRKINSRITGAFNEGIMGARTTKTLVREDANLSEFQVITGEMREQSIRAAVLSSIFQPAVLTIGSIGTALALWSGGSGVIAGTLTYGTLVAFIFASIQFFEPIMELSRLFADMQYAQASAERVIALVGTRPEIVDSADVLAKFGLELEPGRARAAAPERADAGLRRGGANRAPLGAPGLPAHDPFGEGPRPALWAPKERSWPAISGDVSFRSVGFAYKTGEVVLDDFNLEVRAGERIALVGETGSGKSTIVNLLCRFYEPTKGRILIDGVDYRERPLLWLHSNLGYVLQAPHLFSGTVRENIRYGRLDATDEEVMEAARLVNADEFIRGLEKGYDTEAGEGGGRLSTGEKQLISFARALIADPSLFVLDEATSSIDTETERLIQHAIERVLEGRTSFIIAHRLSTIRTADRILVIRGGKIEEQGTHEELLARGGYYHRLYTNQFLDEEELRLLTEQE